MPAFQMAYTASISQTKIPASYWVASTLSLNPGKLTFQGYNSASDYQAGCRPIALHNYNFTFTALQAFVNSYQLSQAQLASIAADGTLPAGTIMGIAMAYALTLDSFFQNATVVN